VLLQLLHNCSSYNETAHGLKWKPAIKQIASNLNICSLSKMFELSLLNDCLVVTSKSSFLPIEVECQNDNNAHIYQMRFEAMVNNSSDNILPGYEYFSTKIILKCSNCKKTIDTYSLYKYEKEKYVKTAQTQINYYCNNCIAEFEAKQSFPIPKKKLMPYTIPAKERVKCWKNVNTGDTKYEPPFEKESLDPSNITSSQYKNAWEKVKGSGVTLLAQQLNKKEIIVLYPWSIKEVMHQSGLNSRHVVLLYKQVTVPYILRLIEIKVIARAIKALYFLSERGDYDVAVASVNRVLFTLPDSDSDIDKLLTYANNILNTDIDRSIITAFNYLNLIKCTLARKIFCKIDIKDDSIFLSSDENIYVCNYNRSYTMT
jgi:hypothetical protein